jgi:hypothetical protein
MNIEDYVKLIRKCIEQNRFSFRNQFYKQISGLGMGKPLLPFLANLFMIYIFLNNVLNNNGKFKF